MTDTFIHLCLSNSNTHCQSVKFNLAFSSDIFQSCIFRRPVCTLSDSQTHNSEALKHRIILGNVYRVESSRRGIVQVDQPLPEKSILLDSRSFPDLQRQKTGSCRRVVLLYEQVEALQDPGWQSVPRVYHRYTTVTVNAFRFAGFHRVAEQVVTAVISHV